ncbi:MAG: TRAP transporter substrate-binding protein DctP [Desulfobacterales bacterium]|nr:TRAP transporter substrate-binding protein DctP [Desulfobacterales bacterium]
MKRTLGTTFRGILCIVAAMFLMVVIMSQTSPAYAKDKIVWKATSAYGAGLSYHQHAEYFAQRVKEMSGGRLIIQMNTGGSIVPVFSEQEAVHRGSIDLSCSSSMYIRGKFPAAVQLGTSMYAFTQQEFMAWLEYGGGYELWQAMYDNKDWNVKVLPAFCIYGTESLGWYRKPIRKPEDFKGMKYRTVGEWGEVVQSLGGSVISIPGGELYSALEKGVLDGTDMSHPSFDKGLGLYEICNYNVYPGVHQTSGPMETLVNKDKWNALPDDLKQIVIAALRETTFRSMTKTIIEDAEAVEFFRSKGVEIIRLSPEMLDVLKNEVNKVLDERAEKYPFYGVVLKSKRDFHEKWKKYEDLQSW